MREIIKKIDFHAHKLAQFFGHYEFLGECLKHGIAPKTLIHSAPLDAIPPDVRQPFIDLQYIHALQTTQLLHTQYYHLSIHHKNNLDDTIQASLLAFPHLNKIISDILNRARGIQVKDRQRLHLKFSKLIRSYRNENIPIPFHNQISTPSFLNLKPTNLSSLFCMPQAIRTCNQQQRLVRTNTNDESNLINLSSKILNSAEKSVLSKGLTFCPTNKINVFEITKDILTFGRNLKWKYFWHNRVPSGNNSNGLHEALQKFKLPSSNEPPPLPAGHPIDTFINHILHKISDPNFINSLQSSNQNLSISEKIALSKLKNDESIMVLPADKGSTTVILNKIDYINEGLRQLNDASFYTTVTADPCEQLVVEIQNYIYLNASDEGLSDNDISALIPSNPRTPHFYMLPKVHKAGNPGRPIVASYDCPTERISSFVDFYAQPLVKNLDSHIKDTYHFLNIIKNIHIPNCNDIFLVTIDVVSLYTNIPHDEGLYALKEYFDSRPNPRLPSSKFLLDLAEIVLINNYFTFNNKFYHQEKGTAMGTRMAPSYANLYMGSLETKFLNSQILKPLTWLRFIDDIFMIWPHSLQTLNTFLSQLNSFSSLRFTHEISKTNITFLDVDITYNNHNISTSVHFKDTNKLQYLHYSSCHPSHTKRSIPHSLSIRGKRICNNSTSLAKYQGKIFNGLCRRDYPPNFLHKHMNRPSNTPNAIHTQQQNSLRLIIPYFHGAHKIQNLLKDSFSILKNNNITRNLLETCPSVTYKQNQNLKAILAKNKNTRCNNTLLGTHKCNQSRCKTCPIINSDINIKTHHNPDIIKIQNFAQCTTSHCVYMLECRFCNSFYVGETTTPLRTRMNGHRHSVDSQINNILPVPTHARTHNTTFNSCFTVRVLRSFPKTIRSIDLKTWESSFIWQLGAYYSPGLNVMH